MFRVLLFLLLLDDFPHLLVKIVNSADIEFVKIILFLRKYNKLKFEQWPDISPAGPLHCDAAEG